MGEQPKPCWLIHGAEVERPDFVAAVVEGHQAREFGIGPGDIDPLGIDGRRDRSIAAVDVQLVRDAWIIAAPNLLAVLGVDAQDVARRRLSGSALKMKSLSPHSTGELCPMPGSSIRQLRSFSVQLAGIVVVSLSPVPLGPRKRVHSWAVAVELKSIAIVASENEQSTDRMEGPRSRREQLRWDDRLMLPDASGHRKNCGDSMLDRGSVCRMAFSAARCKRGRHYWSQAPPWGRTTARLPPRPHEERGETTAPFSRILRNRPKTVARFFAQFAITYLGPTSPP